jgi:hypothetical protein
MKTNQHTPTRSKSARHNGRSGNDTNKKYRVALFWSQFKRAIVDIEAESLNEAERMADRFRATDVPNWKSFYDRVSVEFVQPAEGGQGHE